jgi:thymidylate synthase/deoxycytidylate deaminase
MLLSKHSADRLFYDSMRKIEIGTDVFTSSPRGLEIKELINQSLVLKNPRKRFIRNPARNFSVKYFAAEMMWYLSGTNQAEFIESFASTWGPIKNDDGTVNSAYGFKIFGGPNETSDLKINQFAKVVKILKEDPDSRRAIIHIKDSSDTLETKDVPCTLSLQFLIRENRLHMITNMRSNDLMWGFCYDLPAFTIFQEILAGELGVEIGNYYHNAGSLHVYSRHYNLMKKCIKSFETCESETLEMNPICDSLLVMRKDSNEFIQNYLKIKSGKSFLAEDVDPMLSMSSKFVQQLAICLVANDKDLRNYFSPAWLSLVTDPALKFFLEKDLEKNPLDKGKKLIVAIQREESPKDTRPKWDQIWLSMADTISKRSYDEKLQVGALIVTDDNTQVLSLGYNGNYAGGPNQRDSGVPGESGMIHAEINALIKLDYNNPKNKKMYLTHSPCLMCAKSIINAGIETVIFTKEFRQTDGLELLKNNGIICKQVQ